MAGYSARQSTFTTGDTITAAHSNNEFNAILAAFHVSTGHKHDGSTAGDGGPISTLFSNAISMGTGADTDIALTFNANTNDGVLTWMEDEDYFKFSDEVLIDGTEKLLFRDTAIYINSSTDGQLDIVADTEIQIAATTIDMNGNVDVSGTLVFGSLGDGTVTITDIADEDNMSSNSSTKLATQQSIKAYVDATVTAEDLDVTSDSGTIAIDLDSETLTIAGGTGLSSSATSNTVTVAVDAAQTSITSILATDLKIGEDNETKIDFEDVNEIHFYADNAEQVYIANGIFGPQTDSDVDLGATGVRWKDAFIDTVTTTGNVTVGGDLTISGDDLTMATNTAGNLLIADGTNYNPTAVGDLSEISSVANDDVLLALDTSGGGLKKITRSTLIAGISAGTEISNVVEDTTPQLGGNLDSQGNSITDVGILGSSYGPTGTPTVITVTVASKTAAHPYYGDGSSSGYFLDGAESPAIDLHGADSVTSSSGYYYKFDQADSSNSGHPLRFYLDAAKTIAYTTGVTTSGTPGTAGAHTTIAVTDQTPSTLYYQCSSHAYMGNYAGLNSAYIASSSAVTIDAVGDITLDADGGDIVFKDAGTTFGSATNTSGNLILKSGTTTALTFAGANATAAGNLAITGNLTVNGTTTTVNSTTVTIDDPVFTLGGDGTPGSDDNKDRGIEFKYHTGSAAKVGFFGYDDSAGAFTFVPDASNSSEVFSGTAGNVVFGNIAGTLTTAAQTNITSVGALDGGSITSNFGTINTGSSNITTTGTVSGGTLTGTLSTAAQTNITSLGTLSALTVDNIAINGTTIGHTDDTDLMTLASGGLTVAGTLEATGNITGTLATAAQTNITSTGALDGGSITSGFGAIDNGTSGIRTNTFTAETSVVPDASGGADLGSTSLEWGDLYIADDKKIYLGSDQNFSIEYDEDGNDTTAVVAAGGVSFAPHGTGTGNGTELRFQELAANGQNYVGFKSPDSISSNEVWVLPNADGTDGQFLKTDGSNALSWGSVASAGTTTLVADGAISNGQPVVITSAGKAAQVTGNAVRSGGVGSEAVIYPTGQYNGYSNNLSSMVYDPDTDRFIFMTSDTADQSQTSTSYHSPISKVLTIGSDKSISQGTAQRMHPNLNANQGVQSNGATGCFSSGYYDTVVNKVYQFIYMAGYGAAEQGVYYTYGTVTGGTTNTISWANMIRVSPDGSTSPTSGDGGHHFAAGTVSGVRYGVWAHKNTTNQHANNGDGSAKIGEMNTSTGAITWNDTAIIIDDSQNGRTLGMDVTFDTSAGKFLIQYTKGEETSGDRDIHIVVATPSGTSSQSTLSLGTPVELINEKTYGGNGSQTFLQYDEDLQRTVCFFMNSGTSRVNGCVISIDGTTPTQTTPSQIINEDCTEGGISATKNTELSTSSTGIYEVICKTSQNELYMINVEVTTSGVSASNTVGPRKFEIPSTGDSDANHYAHHIAHGSSTSTDASCGVLTTFGDGKAPTSDYTASWGNTGANQQARPTAIFRQSDITFSTNLTTENYIGIADANYSDGATATVQIAGNIDDAQSSLTIGQLYYVKPSGGLDRVQGLPKVVAGVATSASTLAIAGPPTNPQVDSRVYIGSRDFRRETDENGNRNSDTTFMIPANIPASEVVAYEIEIHNISINGTSDNTYVYCQPLASDGSTSVMSNTWHAVNSYVLGTSYSSTAYDFTSSTGIPCMLGGKNYGLFNDNQDSFPQVDDTTDDTSSGLYSKCIYTQSNRYGTWNWDATWHGDSDATGGIISIDKGHASTNGDASTTGFAHGFKIYAANSGGSLQSNRYFTQGIVSVYAIVKSDLDRKGVSSTGGNEDFGG